MGEKKHTLTLNTKTFMQQIIFIIALAILVWLTIYISYRSGRRSLHHHTEEARTDGFRHGFEAGKKRGLEEGEARGRTLGFDDGCRYARAQEYNRHTLEAAGIIPPEKAAPARPKGKKK